MRKRFHWKMQDDQLNKEGCDIKNLLLMPADDGQDDKEDQADGDGDKQDNKGRHQAICG